MSGTESLEIPLFPLNTVLYPGGLLPLRIFEPRYLDMVSACLRGGTDFGVVLISQGSEAGEPATGHGVGTLARISDWEQRSDGLLGITVTGGRRFRTMDTWTRPDRLIMGRVMLLPEPEPMELPPGYRPLAELLESIVNQLGPPFQRTATAYGDAGWVAYRLAEVLPLANDARQRLLETENALERLETLTVLLAQLSEG